MKSYKLKFMAAMAAFGMLVGGASLVQAQEDAAVQAEVDESGAVVATGLPLTLAQGLAVLPSDSSVCFTLNLAGFDNPKSLLSYVPRVEMEQTMADAVAKSGQQPPATAMELAGRVAFTSAISSTAQFTGLSVGATLSAANMSQQPVERVVLTGGFKAAEMGPKLAATFGVQPGATAGLATLATSTGKTVHLAMPRDGMLLISEDAAWVSAGGKEGLSKHERFRFTWAALQNAFPDAMVWVDSTLLREATAAEPMAAMMMGPLLQSHGLVLVLEPGNEPLLTLLAAYNDRQTSELGVAFFQQMIQLGKAQMQGAAQQMGAADPAAMEKVAEATKWLDKLKTSSTDRSARLSLPLTDLPSREEVRKQMIEGMQQALSGNLQVPMMPGSM